MAHPPKTHQPPTEIAPDTFVIHDHTGEGVAPVMVPINSMLIRGDEPVVVDTGFADNQDQFLTDVFGLVEPEDIRWLFISHDDVDHTGNIGALMDAAPNATLLINWFMFERMGATLDVPLHRTRWIGDGEWFRAGDRQLLAVRPPVFDSPTTRGLFDPVTGVYWGSDSFASPMVDLATDADQLDRGFWTDGMAMFHQYISPWFELLDDAKYQQSVDRIERLGISTIAACHAPTIHEHLIPAAFENIRTFAAATVPDLPGQDVLDQMLAATAVPAA
jgi:flavorubredoxin